jgi:hypothetical protein
MERAAACSSKISYLVSEFRLGSIGNVAVAGWLDLGRRFLMPNDMRIETNEVLLTTLTSGKSKLNLPPRQRMILALFLFVDIALICFSFLLVTGKMTLPF